MALKVFDYQYQIHIVDEVGTIIDTVGQMNGFSVAKAAFDAAAVTHSWSTIELRQCFRVVEVVKTGAYSLQTGMVEILERRR